MTDSGNFGGTTAIRLLGCIALAMTGSGALAADAGHPTVIELFQSQGCSSCPPADANLNALADRPDLLPLNFSVTYWDRLGWKDSSAKPAFTDRQWEYAHAGSRDQVSTPQMIVNGRGVIVGNSRGQLDAAIRSFDRGTSGPAISASGGSIKIGGGAGSRPATVWLVRYDPRILNVAIRAGENGGRTLPHRNIVRSLQRLGDWRGAATSFKLPAKGNPLWHTAVLIQAGKGGPIVAARAI